jgi:hypothetical protein
MSAPVNRSTPALASLLAQESTKKDLFLKLKLVVTPEEFSSLEKICQSGSTDPSDEFKVYHFASVLQQALKDNVEAFSENDLILTFETLFTLIRKTVHHKKNTDGYHNDFAGAALGLYELFKMTSDNYPKSPIKLPPQVHLSAYAMCKDVLSVPISPGKFEWFINALPFIIDYPEFPADELIEVIPNIQKWCADKHFKKWDALASCLKLAHVSPVFRSCVACLLESFVLVKEENSNSAWHRASIIKRLPFYPQHENIDDEIRFVIAATLIKIFENPEEYVEVRLAAVEALCNIIWLHKKGQAELKKDQKIALEALTERLKKCQESTSDELNVNKTVAIYLFFEIAFESWENPALRHLFELYKQFMRKESLPLEVRQALAHRMPHVTGLRNPDPNTGMDLFYFMVNMLYDKSHPMELKIIYVENLVSCYREDALPLITQRFPSLKTVEDLLHLAAIDNCLELKEKASTAYLKLIKEKEELNSRFMPLGNLMVFFP